MTRRRGPRQKLIDALCFALIAALLIGVPLYIVLLTVEFPS